MAYQSIWYFSDLPKDVVEILDRDLYTRFDNEMDESRLHGDTIDKNKRNSKNAWIPTNHWISGFLWHYIQKANRDNFLYDLSHIDAEKLQYTRYEKGEYYNWHKDTGIALNYEPKINEILAGDSVDNKEVHLDYLNQKTEYVRKLSFTLQLSEPTDYRGGEVEFLDSGGKRFLAPKQRGTMIVFDSRTRHRVRKIKSGIRKSIVGWVVGPRWK